MLTLQLTLAARYLWGRKLRTFLTTLAIVFGAWVIFGVIAALISARSSGGHGNRPRAAVRIEIRPRKVFTSSQNARSIRG